MTTATTKGTAEGRARARRRRQRKGHSFPPAHYSGRVYVEIASHQVHLFRYLLEAYDNLGMMTVVDRWRAVLLVRFSPHQEYSLHEALVSMQQCVPFTLIPYTSFL